MKKRSKLTALLLCLSVCLGMLTGCGSTNTSAAGDSANAATSGDTVTAGENNAAPAPMDTDTPQTLVYGADAEMSGISPFDAQNQCGLSIVEAVYDKLFQSTDSGEFEPRLATSWEWKDDTTLILNIREGVKFHDGADLTADDVLCSLRTLAENPGQASRFAAVNFDDCYCDGDYTVVLKTTEYYAPLIGALSRAYIADQGWIEANEDLSRIENGTGPYTLQEWNMGSNAVLKKNADYWGDAAYYETVDVRFYNDATTAFLEFESGTLDIVYVQNQEDVDRMNAGEIDGAYMEGVNINAVTALNMSQMIEGSPYQDINLRKAIAHAIDWNTMITSVCGSTVQLATSILPSKDPNHIELGAYEYNTQLAKEAADQYKADHGISGDIELTIVVPEKDYNVALCEAMQAYLAEIGIALSIESGQLFDIFPRMMNGEVMITINQLTGGGSSHDTFQSMEPGCNNLVAEYTDQEICDLLVDVTKTADTDKQAEMYKKIQQLNYDGYWAIPMYEGLHFFAAKNNVQGITLLPSDYSLNLQSLYAAG